VYLGKRLAGSLRIVVYIRIASELRPDPFVQTLTYTAGIDGGKCWISPEHNKRALKPFLHIPVYLDNMHVWLVINVSLFAHSVISFIIKTPPRRGGRIHHLDSVRAEDIRNGQKGQRCEKVSRLPPETGHPLKNLDAHVPELPPNELQQLQHFERGFCLLKGIAEGTYNTKHAEAAKPDFELSKFTFPQKLTLQKCFCLFFWLLLLCG
jgi:hypothetical protein